MKDIFIDINLFINVTVKVYLDIKMMVVKVLKAATCDIILLLDYIV